MPTYSERTQSPRHMRGAVGALTMRVSREIRRLDVRARARESDTAETGRRRVCGRVDAVACDFLCFGWMGERQASGLIHECVNAHANTGGDQELRISPSMQLAYRLYDRHRVVVPPSYNVSYKSLELGKARVDPLTGPRPRLGYKSGL